MFVFNTPHWVDLHRFSYRKFDEIPTAVFSSINSRLDKIKSIDPQVSIVIAAWNEEINILNCVSSLSCMESSIPFEIIVVNNNSSDATQKTIDNLHVKCLFQPIPGCGPARQMGQEHAKGKYILLADADCIYPACWVDAMVGKLEQQGVVCVYGRYSFIEELNYPRWKLFVLEKMKDIIAEFRHYKRPYLNAYGISMGYIKEFGLKVGFVGYKIWGDDGRLCFDLMEYGQVKQVKRDSARLWTAPRTLQRDGSLAKAILARIKIEMRRFSSLFTAHPPHDTKISKNA